MIASQVRLPGRRETVCHPGGRTARESRFGIKVGNPGWESRLGIQVENPGWEPTGGIQPGDSAGQFGLVIQRGPAPPAPRPRAPSPPPSHPGRSGGTAAWSDTRGCRRDRATSASSRRTGSITTPAGRGRPRHAPRQCRTVIDTESSASINAAVAPKSVRPEPTSMTGNSAVSICARQRPKLQRHERAGRHAAQKAMSASVIDRRRSMAAACGRPSRRTCQPRRVRHGARTHRLP